jgi:hypothetical protein
MTAVAAQTGSRPEARVFKVEDLIRHARAGRIRVPSFQRSFKWERSDVENLIDSVWRGYPIGTLLLWAKPGPAEMVKLGDLTFEVNELKEAWFVVDGQQRIVSLVSTLLRDRPRPPKFDIYFDLVGGAVVHGGRGNLPPTHLPLDRVVDSEDLLAWIDEHREALTPDHRRLALRVGKLVREYEIPAYVVDVEDEAIVRQIFSRTNDTGKRLEASDVFNALHAPFGTKPSASLKDVADRLQARSLGEIDEDSVLRSLLAIEGKDTSGDLSRQLRDVDVPAAVARSERALERVFGFLAQDAGIPHLRLLPYKSPLAVLSAFFDRFATPSPRARRLLVRWLWRGTASEELRGDGKGTRPALEAVRSAGMDEIAAAAVLGTVSAQRPPTPPASAFNLRHARSRVLAMVLVGLRPRDLRTGAPLDMAALLGSTNEVFPQIYGSVRESNGEQKRALLSSVGNRLLHPALGDVDAPAPSDAPSLMKLLQQRSEPLLFPGDQATADNHILASHGVDGAAAALLAKGDRAAFLETRRDQLEADATKLVDGRADWGHSDRVSIAALSDEGD